MHAASAAALPPEIARADRFISSLSAYAVDLPGAGVSQWQMVTATSYSVLFAWRKAPDAKPAHALHTASPAAS